jgi:hypothetical protein
MSMARSHKPPSVSPPNWSYQCRLVHVAPALDNLVAGRYVARLVADRVRPIGRLVDILSRLVFAVGAGLSGFGACFGRSILSLDLGLSLF